MIATRALLVSWLAAVAFARPLTAADTEALDRWLAGQTNVQTWAASFTQTRQLKTLVQPLVTPGRVWFQAPDSFRWELGQPVQTIALRQSNTVWVIYPALKRAEVYDLAAGSGPWKDALGLLEAGFPRSRAELDARFNLVGAAVSNDVAQVSLAPKSAAARRLVRGLTIGFSPAGQALHFTAMTFADGSVMRNDFTNAVVNPAWTEDPFRPAIGADYTITHPLGTKSPR